MTCPFPFTGYHQGLMISEFTGYSRNSENNVSLKWGAVTFYLDLMGSENFGKILDKELKQ